MVVEGWVFDHEGPYTVQLTKTTGYFSAIEPPPILNAIVTISENNTFTDTLFMTEPGAYQTVSLLQSKMGATYTLKIFHEGEIYEAVSTLRPVAPIDTLTFRFRDSSTGRREGYLVSIYFQEPPRIGNFYRWLFYRNDEIVDRKDEMYASDEFYDGNYIIFEFGKRVNYGDTVRIEMFSMDRAGYDFFNALDEQDNTGDLFDTPPGNVKGNISNGAIGYFGASSVSKKEIIIED